jgi:hypothetical protein
VARDSALVVVAAVARERGDVRQASVLLEALEGKIIDPMQRFLYARQRAATEIDLGHPDRAVHWMHRWLAVTPAHALSDTRARIAELIAAMPTSGLGPEVLSGELAEREDERPSELAARRWLRNLVRDRLAASVLKDQDRVLAKRLINTAPARWRSGTLGVAVAKVAAGKLTRPRVEGRAVGLVFSVGSESARRRSAAVVVGMTRRLGSFGPGEHRSPVRLLTRQDGGGGVQLQRALSLLASDGAAMLVAGTTPEDAAVAAEHAAQARVPTLLLSEPEGGLLDTNHAFVLGISSSHARQVVADAVDALSVRASARVGGPDDAGCLSSPGRPGQPRFPIPSWTAERVDVVVLDGSPACTRSALGELRRFGFLPTLVFGLESAELARDVDWPAPRWVVSVGRFPNFDAPKLPEGSLPGLSRPSFYELLGRDAAALSVAALADLPARSVTEDEAEVRELHRKVSRALVTARAELETAEAPGFVGDRRLKRRLGVVAVPDE